MVLPIDTGEIISVSTTDMAVGADAIGTPITVTAKRVGILEVDDGIAGFELVELTRFNR
jgi:hypothetical protein